MSLHRAEQFTMLMGAHLLYKPSETSKFRMNIAFDRLPESQMKIS